MSESCMGVQLLYRRHQSRLSAFQALGGSRCWAACRVTQKVIHQSQLGNLRTKSTSMMALGTKGCWVLAPDLEGILALAKQEEEDVHDLDCSKD